MENKRILIVDDEPGILKSLQRCFKNEDFIVEISDSPIEVLNTLKDYQPAVIISDMRMPIMNGIEFLVNAQSICPEAIRIILSGYSDIDKIIEAINKNHIYRYISKPWDDKEIKTIIKQALNYYQALKDKEELTLKIQSQNRELKFLNEKLEDLVNDRTLELQTRDNILQHLLEIHPLHISIELILSQIQKLYRFESIAFYSKTAIVGEDIVFGLKYNNSLTTDFSEILKKELPVIIESKDYVNLIFEDSLVLHSGGKYQLAEKLAEVMCPGGDIVAIAVKNSVVKFGLLLCGSYESEEYLYKIFPKIDGFANYLAIALNDNIECGNIELLKNKVDNILKEI